MERTAKRPSEQSQRNYRPLAGNVAPISYRAWTLQGVFFRVIVATILLLGGAMNAKAAVVDCQAARPDAGYAVHLYFPTASDSDFPNDVGGLGLTTSPLADFDVADLASGIGTTGQLRAAISERVRTDYCEFDVRIVETTSANGTTNPTPSDSRWQVIGIGSDNIGGRTLYGVANDVDIGDNDVADFARVWAREFFEAFGGSGGALAGANSTRERWANAIAGTVTHEAGHNFGLSHDDSISQPSEDARRNHIMASGRASAGGLTGADRVRDRHFSDASFEILAANIGLFEQTVSNWDFINPNDSTADGFGITVLVLPGDGTPSKGSIYTGGLSPWNDVSISADGSETFQGTTYNRFQIDFTDPKNWNNGDPGEVGAGVEFHVGVGLTTNYVVRDVFFTSGGSTMELNPRVVGYTTGGSFDPDTGDFHLTFSNARPEDGPLTLSNIRVRHLPRTLDINQMVAGGKLTGVDGRQINPWKQRLHDAAVDVLVSADVTLGNLAEGRAIDKMLQPEPGCRRGVGEIPPIGDAESPFEVEYCPEGHALGLFPSTRVYVEATVTDPKARYFDNNLGRFVTGPLSSRIFVQLPGVKPDLNGNGVDDAIDLDDGTCTDDNANGVCDQAEPTRYKYAAKILCGLQDDPTNMRIARGFYATAINIMNPGEESVRFRKSLSLTFPPDEQRPGKVMPIGEDKLGPDQALEVDCIDIQRKLFPNGFPSPYIKGFVAITSNGSLDVTAVYSSRGVETPCHKAEGGREGRWHERPGSACCSDHHHDCHGRHGKYCCEGAGSNALTLDVEQVKERVIERKQPPASPLPPPKECPDLVIRDIGRPNVRCPGGGGTCRTRVEVTVANIGNAASGPFDVRTVFDPKQSVTVDQSLVTGLTAGEHRTLDLLTPPGGNCFDPDCTITATADPDDKVGECSEQNNRSQETTRG